MKTWEDLKHRMKNYEDLADLGSKLKLLLDKYETAIQFKDIEEIIHIVPRLENLALKSSQRLLEISRDEAIAKDLVNIHKNLDHSLNEIRKDINTGKIGRMLRHYTILMKLHGFLYYSILTWTKEGGDFVDILKRRAGIWIRPTALTKQERMFGFEELEGE